MTHLLHGTEFDLTNIEPANSPNAEFGTLSLNNMNRRFTMNTVTNSFALATLILACIGNDTAFAAVTPTFDAKNYSGAQCTARIGSQAALLNHDFTGTVNISTTTPVDVTCPVVKDNNSNLARTVQLLIRVNELNKIGGTVCNLVGLDPWGGVRTVYGVRTTTLGGNYLGMNIPDDGGVGNYQVTCTLSPRSAVYNYMIIESLDTDNDS